MSYEGHLWGSLDFICLVFLFIIFAYFIVMEAYAGRTVGKRILEMRVVGRAGNKISPSKAIIRNSLRLVDGLAFNILGTMLIANSPTGQRFGDRVTKTYVLKEAYRWLGCADKTSMLLELPTARFSQYR